MGEVEAIVHEERNPGRRGDVADGSREAERDASQATPEVEDPEAAAQRTQRDAMDAAKEESIAEERATLDSTESEIAGEERVVADRGDSAESAAKDPDEALKGEAKKTLDD